MSSQSTFVKDLREFYMLAKQDIGRKITEKEINRLRDDQLWQTQKPPK